uniref:NAC domain-containing protein n=1 Tax=Rhizophora mucronata TaxID=61149 RepID=A0A2P2INB9_RHIMU
MTSEMNWVDRNRFCPTEEEMVNLYLKPKILGTDHQVSQIQELDVFSKEPWNLPEHLKITPNDLEWYFFCARYLNAGRPNRKSNVGYWKETGKSRKIMTQLPNGMTGKRRIFVFYMGRFPNGVNTKCVMHEFSAAISPPNDQRTFVLCKIMKRADKKITVPTYDEGETSGTPKSVANDEVPGEVRKEHVMWAVCKVSM